MNDLPHSGEVSHQKNLVAVDERSRPADQVVVIILEYVLLDQMGDGFIKCHIHQAMTCHSAGRAGSDCSVGWKVEK